MSPESKCLPGLLLSLVLLVGALGVGGCNQRKHSKIRHDQLEEKSKTPACKKELVAALANLRATLGLGFAPAESDTVFLFRKGYLRKGYARDGTQYSFSFGLTLKDGSCHLRMYNRTTNRPGEHTSRTGNFGSVKLTKCTCK